MEDLPLSAYFQRLCQHILDGSSKNVTRKNIEDFRVLLHLIMHECSKANIETGRKWVLEYCQAPHHMNAILEYMLALSRSRTSQTDRIHLIYLLNDVVFHTARKQITWMQEAMLPLLVPLLRMAYEAAESAEYEAKIMKVIGFWGDQNIFEPQVISRMKRDIMSHPFQNSFVSYPQHMPSVPPPHANSLQQGAVPLPIPPPPPPPAKPYHELPAGLMLFAKSEDYQPVDPTLIRVPFPRPPPTQELITAVDEFYQGLDLSSADSVIIDEKATRSNIDAQGWEKGYLDEYTTSIHQRKQQRNTRSPSREQYHDRREYLSPSRGRSRSRTPPPRYRQRLSRSPPSMRSRSPSPAKTRSPSRNRYQRRYSRSHSRSPSPPPPSLMRSSNTSYGSGKSNGFGRHDFSGVPQENKYMGLGSKSAMDEFDHFRRNKSQAFNRREPHQPFTCYRCNKVGHLARECNSL